GFARTKVNEGLQAACYERRLSARTGHSLAENQARLGGVVSPSRQRDDPVIGRRTFIGGLGFGLIAAPLMIRAQQQPKVYRIGCLLPFRGTAEVEAAVNGKIEGRRDRGGGEGRDI